MSVAFCHSKLNSFTRCLYNKPLCNLSRRIRGSCFRKLDGTGQFYRHDVKVTLPAASVCTVADPHFRVELQTEKRLNAIWQGTVAQAGSGGGGDVLLKKGDTPETSCLFHAVWLRYNCQCPQCIASSGQKTTPVEASDPDLKLTSANISDGKLHMSWSCGHNGHVGVEWLKRHRYVVPEVGGEDNTKPLVATEMPSVDAAELQEDIGLWRWLRNLNEYGVCLVTNLEPRVGKVIELARMMYNAQPTVYGETFTVVSEEVPVNIAYTTSELELHMDQLHYESPPGLQMLHCVRFDSCVEGGESVVLDSFPVMEEFRKEHPKHFETLKRVPVTFQKIHYGRADPVDMVYQRPHVVVDEYDRITAINWCPLLAGPLLAREEDIIPYYEAYHTLWKMFNASDLKLVHRLKEGEVLTLNNRRVMHARNKFQLNGGMRHLEGVYVNIDEFKSKFKTLCSKVGKPDYPVKRVLNYQGM